MRRLIWGFAGRTYQHGSCILQWVDIRSYLELSCYNPYLWNSTRFLTKGNMLQGKNDYFSQHMLCSLIRIFMIVPIGHTNCQLTLCLLAANFVICWLFYLDLDRTSVFIRNQTVWHSDSVPESMFWKRKFWKKICRRQNSMKNFH